MTASAPLPEVTVVGLGPGAPGLVTAEALAAIGAVPVRFVRTGRHPSASLVTGTSFDYLYEQADDLAEVYAGIVEALVAAAQLHGRALYAVPGSPVVAERSVQLLRQDGRVATTVLPALSFVDLAFERLGVDPLAAAARLVDGHRFAAQVAGYRGPLLVGQCDSVAVLSDVKLAIAAVVEAVAAGPPEGAEGAGEAGLGRGQGPEVVVLQHLGLPDEVVSRVSWQDLDRAVGPDHLTSVWVPELEAPFAPEMARLDELVRTLRARCPWDRQQTHQSLSRYLLEEAYEVLDAIDELGSESGYEHLEEELGDVLFQVFFHSALAAEQGQFTVADVARTVHDKLVARHPHVFGDVEARTPDDVARNWEQIKAKEKGRSSVMDGIPGNLPALMYANKVQKKAASIGFDWDGAEGALSKVAEELSELAELVQPPGAGWGAGEPGATPGTPTLAGDRQRGSSPGTGASRGTGASPERVREELGDLLFAVVNVARHVHVDPEAALREATAKFRRRFSALEALGTERRLDLPSAGLAALDALWDEVKATES